MNIGILILLSSCVVSIKIFSFDPGVDEKLAKVLLEKSREEVLPERFIVCFAMRQNNIDGRSPFLITDKKKQPWLALSIWDVGNQLALWAEVGKKDWKLFHALKVPWKFWTHICADLDTVTGNISVSIDGRPAMSDTSEKLKEGKAEKLHEVLQIGITDTEPTNGGRRQYQGSLSNLNFHFHQESISIEDLSRNPCETEGSYLAWSRMAFSKIGEGIVESEGTQEDVCSVFPIPETHKVLLPGLMSWTKADFLCKILGEGEMVEVENEEEIEKTSSWIQEATDSCPLVWVPISDERSEGIWENTNTNVESKFLPWSEGQPNGQRTQNHAGIHIASAQIRDFFDEDPHCAYCSLNTRAFLKLRGLCKDSYLGIVTSKRRCSFLFNFFISNNRAESHKEYNFVLVWIH